MSETEDEHEIPSFQSAEQNEEEGSSFENVPIPTLSTSQPKPVGRITEPMLEDWAQAVPANFKLPKAAPLRTLKPSKRKAVAAAVCEESQMKMDLFESENQLTQLKLTFFRQQQELKLEAAQLDKEIKAIILEKEKTALEKEKTALEKEKLLLAIARQNLTKMTGNEGSADQLSQES